MWAVRIDGSWRCVDSTIPLEPEESLFDEIPQWALDIQSQKTELLERERLNAAWRDEELAVISNQMMAIEEREAGVEAEDAQPASRLIWLTYRSAVRNWSGMDDRRPERPA